MEKIQCREYCNPVKPAYVKFVDYGFFTSTECYSYGCNNRTKKIFMPWGMTRRNSGRRHDTMVLWLASGALYPSVFLPSALLRWKAESSESARLLYDDGNIICNMLVFFNDHNEIGTIETEPADQKISIMFWRIHFKNYQHVYNYYIPSVIESYHVVDG